MVKLKNQQIILEDGRSLGYAEYGNPIGEPVVLCHGQPGNRFFYPPLIHRSDQPVRLIVPDRPGYGLSTLQPERAIIDWPQDILTLIRHLGYNAFHLIGYSGGGPYALACGHQIAQHLLSVSLISCAPPVDIDALRKILNTSVRINYAINQVSPKLLTKFFTLYWKIAIKNPETFIQMMINQSPQADQESIMQKENYAMLFDTWTENLRVDSHGYTQDANLLLSPFALKSMGV